MSVTQLDWIAQIHNKPFSDPRAYIFNRVGRQGLTAGIIAVVPLSNPSLSVAFPAGIAALSVNIHYLRITDGVHGAEQVLITAVDLVSGTVTFTPALNHTSGDWQIGTATNGCQEAVIAAAGTNARIQFPAGMYTTYATISIPGSGVWIAGGGPGSTTLTIATQNQDIIKFTGFVTADCGVHDIKLVGQAASTSGFGINVFAQFQCSIENVHILNCASGIKVDGGSGVNLLLVKVENPKGHGVEAIEGPNPMTVRDLTVTADTPGSYLSGIHLSECLNALIKDCQILGAQNGILIDPGTGHAVVTIDIEGTYMDASTVTGMRIAPTGSGEVSRIRCLLCWFGDGVKGVVVATTGGTIKGLWFTFCIIGNNTSNGAEINAGSDILFHGNILTDNNAGSGIALAAGLEDVAIEGNKIGNGFGGFTLSGQVAGVYISGVITNLRICGNTFKDNFNWPILFPAANMSSAVIANNLGIDDVVQVIASAGTLSLAGNSVVRITGTTAVTSILYGWNNRRVRIYKTDAGSVTVLGRTLASGAFIDVFTPDGSTWF